MLQNYARKDVIAIDKVSFDFKYMDQMAAAEVKERPNTGCYIYGLYLEGCRWDPMTHMLAESRPK
jgi:dynein heavy chain